MVHIYHFHANFPSTLLGLFSVFELELEPGVRGLFVSYMQCIAYSWPELGSWNWVPIGPKNLEFLYRIRVA